MMSRLILRIEYWLLVNNYLLPYPLQKYFDFPSKRIVRYYLENSGIGTLTRFIEHVAHTYAYDSTVSKGNIGVILVLYDIHTRERVRQILMKFLRTNRH